MNKAELKEKVIELNLPKIQFNGEMDPGFVYDDTQKGKWIFYNRDERGGKFGYKEFYSESEACDYCLKLLVEVHESYLEHKDELEKAQRYKFSMSEYKKNRKFTILFDENTPEVISMSKVFFVMAVVAHQFDSNFDPDRQKSYNKGYFSATEIFHLLMRDTNASYCIKSSDEVEQVLACAFNFGWLVGKMKDKPNEENRYRFNGNIHIVCL